MERATKLEIYGKELTPDQLRQASERIASESRERLAHMLFRHPERPKTPDEEAEIEAGLGLLQQEAARLSGVPQIHLSSKNVHILLPDAVTDGEGRSGILAGRAFVEIGELIVFDYDQVDALHKIQTIIHEATHLLTKDRMTITRDDEVRFALTREKFGYESTARITEASVTPTNFRGVNEAMTEHVALSVVGHLYHRQGEIFGKERYSAQQFMRFMGDFYRLSDYAHPLQIVESIVRRVSVETRRGEGDVWDEFSKGLFTGSMMHLRQVEKIYGKNALRYLAEMPLGPEEYDGNEKAYERDINAMRDFFV